MEQLDADDSYTLHTVTRKRSVFNGPGIPIWSFTGIHLSDIDAQKSLLAEVVDGAVRFVGVTDFTQLQESLRNASSWHEALTNLY